MIGFSELIQKFPRSIVVFYCSIQLFFVAIILFTKYIYFYIVLYVAFGTRPLWIFPHIIPSPASVFDFIIQLTYWLRMIGILPITFNVFQFLYVYPSELSSVLDLWLIYSSIFFFWLIVVSSICGILSLFFGWHSGLRISLVSAFAIMIVNFTILAVNIFSDRGEPGLFEISVLVAPIYVILFILELHKNKQNPNLANQQSIKTEN